MRTKLELLHDDGEPRVTIFIHGYLAAREKEDLRGIQRSINCLRLPGKVYLLKWASGTRMGAVRGALVVHFEKYQSRAQRIGRLLPSMLRNRIGNTSGASITLCGHSLGARIIHWGLKYGDWSGLELRDIVLLAGKTPMNGDEGDWSQCLAPVQGKVFNLYSHSDGLVEINPDNEDCVGASRLSGLKEKVVNIHTGLGHTDYWDELPHWYRSKNMPIYEPSREHPAPALCPFCHFTLMIRADIKEECPRCLCNFSYSHQDWTPYFDKVHPEPLELLCPHCGEGPLLVQGSAEYYCHDCKEWTKVRRRDNTLLWDAPCPTCEGSGWVDCEECSEGDVPCPKCEDGLRECGHCGGDGCGHCKGGDIDCLKCDATGWVPCKYCKGAQQVPCSECKCTGLIKETSKGGYMESEKVAAPRTPQDSMVNFDFGTVAFPRLKRPRPIT